MTIGRSSRRRTVLAVLCLMLTAVCLATARWARRSATEPVAVAEAPDSSSPVVSGPVSESLERPEAEARPEDPREAASVDKRRATLFYPGRVVRTERPAFHVVTGRVVLPDGVAMQPGDSVVGQDRSRSSRQSSRAVAPIASDGTFRLELSPTIRNVRLSLQSEFLRLSGPSVISVPRSAPVELVAEVGASLVAG